MQLGGGKSIFLFSPLGKWSNLTNIFQMGWNHQPGRHFGNSSSHLSERLSSERRNLFKSLSKPFAAGEVKLDRVVMYWNICCGTGGTFSLDLTKWYKICVCCFDARSQPEFTQMKWFVHYIQCQRHKKKCEKVRHAAFVSRSWGVNFLGATTWMFFK